MVETIVNLVCGIRRVNFKSNNINFGSKSKKIGVSEHGMEL